MCAQISIRSLLLAIARPSAYLLVGLVQTLLVGCGAESLPLHPANVEGIPIDVRAKADPDVFAAASRGETLELLVVLNENLIERQAVARGEPPLPDEPQARLQRSLSLYSRATDDLSELLSAAGMHFLRGFGPIPVLSVRISSLSALIALLRDQRVIGVDQDQPVPLMLNESLPMIGQPGARARGFGGRGVAVAVLDTGVDPRHVTNLQVTQDIRDDGVVDDCYDSAPGHRGNCHGTNVSAIVNGVAPDANLIVIDVFDDWAMDGSATTSWGSIVSAYEWIMNNKFRFNIIAVNMSLGRNDNVCPDDNAGCTSSSHNCTHAVRVAIAAARSLGVLTIASAGNSCNTNRVGFPACVPEVLSVGAVYDDTLMPLGWGCQGTDRNCEDLSPARDQITCFSNSSPALSLLAPGACITAGGLDPNIESCDGRRTFSFGGTSQAAPHVTGAAAVLSAAYPWMGPDEITDCLRRTGIPITDPRNQVTTPRLNLLAAVSECYAPCYARCCQGQGEGSLVGPMYLGDAASCRTWGEQACSLAGGTIRIEYNQQEILGISSACGAPCYVRCCDGYLAGPKYFKDKGACGSWRQTACVGHGGPARVQFDGSPVPPDETGECSKRCEYLCCDGFTPVASQKSDRNSCLAGRSVCETHGDAVAVTYGGFPAWVGNGTCSGACSARCCNGSTESLRTTNPRSCTSASLCAGPNVGGASRTVFKPDLAKHEGFPVKDDVVCQSCAARCCDGTLKNQSYANEALCKRDAPAFCGPVGVTKDVTFDGNPVDVVGASCVVAYARCCKNDPSDPDYDPRHGHLEGPKYAKDGMTAESEAPLWCAGYGGALRLSVDGRYRTGLKPGCMAGPAYAICKTSTKVGPMYYLDCKDDLITLVGELKQECSDEGGLVEIEYKGKTVWDRGTESCP